MDERFLELAEEIQLKQTEARVKTQAASAIPNTDRKPEEYLAEECEDCSDPLPEFRKQKGLIRCVCCQEAIERKTKRGY